MAYSGHAGSVVLVTDALARTDPKTRIISGRFLARGSVDMLPDMVSESCRA